jgi:hypothetical protein
MFEKAIASMLALHGETIAAKMRQVKLEITTAILMAEAHCINREVILENVEMALEIEDQVKKATQ